MFTELRDRAVLNRFVKFLWKLKRNFRLLFKSTFEFVKNDYYFPLLKYKLSFEKQI